MTLLVASVVASNPHDAAADIAAAVAAGADAVELRVDHLADAEDVVIRSIAAERPPGVPLILTIRPADEGGAWDADEMQRIARLIALGPAADWIDVEFAAWQRSANIRQKIGLARRDGGREQPARMILSAHDFRGRPVRLLSQLAAMCDENEADAVKIAWMARTVRDNFEAFDLMRSAPKPLTAICMGPAGQLSRILGRKFGAHLAFAAANGDRPAAPGQLSVEELLREYRWCEINADTELYGVIGDPLEHSLSPAVHNAAFAALGLNAVYVPIPVPAGYESLKALLVEIRGSPWLGFRGFSVTIPHKEDALRCLHDAGEEAEPLCGEIGAVNTLCVRDDGRLFGANTDAPAAMDVIDELLGRPGGPLSGLRCLVLGAGGVARAIVAGLRARAAEVCIANRTGARAGELASEFAARAVAWDDRLAEPYDLLVNCTSVGLWPQSDQSPMPAEALRAGAAVFDTIYRPAETRLVADARGRGLRAEGGLSMFLRQAARQFELWTGRAAPLDRMSSTAAARLGGDAS